MKHKLRIVIATSALSVIYFQAVAKDTPGFKPAGSGLEATLPEKTRLVEQDARNADTAITTRIRKEIGISKKLSHNAKNVMITTIGGKVMLTGAVTSLEEKHSIGAIAIGVQRRENVENQLIVGTPPSAPTGLRVIQ